MSSIENFNRNSYQFVSEENAACSRSVKMQKSWSEAFALAFSYYSTKFSNDCELGAFKGSLI